MCEFTYSFRPIKPGESEDFIRWFFEFPQLNVLKDSATILKSRSERMALVRELPQDHNTTFLLIKKLVALGQFANVVARLDYT